VVTRRRLIMPPGHRTSDRTEQHRAPLGPSQRTSHAYVTPSDEEAAHPASRAVLPFRDGFVNGGRRRLIAAGGDRIQDRHFSAFVLVSWVLSGEWWCPRQDSNLRHTVEEKSLTVLAGASSSHYRWLLFAPHRTVGSASLCFAPRPAP